MALGTATRTSTGALLGLLVAVAPSGGCGDGAKKITKLALSPSGGCALDTAGRIYCWGGHRTRPAPKEGIDHAKDLLGGGPHCATFDSSTPKCWGEDSFDLFGTGESYVSEPVEVEAMRDTSIIALADHHVCTLDGQGVVRCWGSNGTGQLGVEGLESSRRPVEVKLPATADRVWVTHGMSCARLVGGSVHCWGGLPIAAAGESVLPRAVPELEGIEQLAGGFFHACALTSEGRVSCWGRGMKPMLLGRGKEGGKSSTPREVPGLEGVQQIASDTDHNCALLGSGTVKCWGANDHGALGDGTRQDRATPTLVEGLEQVVEIAVSVGSSCARTAAHEVRCWGDNAQGQLGDGTTEERLEPTLVRW